MDYFLKFHLIFSLDSKIINIDLFDFNYTDTLESPPLQ